MGDKGVELDERSGVEEQIEPLARGQLPPLMLALDSNRAATEARFETHLLEARQPLFVRRHGQCPRCA
jgi:hypothetical protein